jgi:hypothetical protein
MAKASAKIMAKASKIMAKMAAQWRWRKKSESARKYGERKIAKKYRKRENNKEMKDISMAGDGSGVIMKIMAKMKMKMKIMAHQNINGKKRKK